MGAVTAHEVLYDEVVTASEELQRLVQKPIRHFAFPYGQHVNLNPMAFDLAYKSGFHSVSSAYGGFNFPGDDAFHLQRIPVDNDMIRLKNWVTIDPRKITKTVRYRYEHSDAPYSHERTATNER